MKKLLLIPLILILGACSLSSTKSYNNIDQVYRVKPVRVSFENLKNTTKSKDKNFKFKVTYRDLRLFENHLGIDLFKNPAQIYVSYIEFFGGPISQVNIYSVEQNYFNNKEDDLLVKITFSTSSSIKNLPKDSLKEYEYYDSYQFENSPKLLIYVKSDHINRVVKAKGIYKINNMVYELSSDNTYDIINNFQLLENYNMKSLLNEKMAGFNN